MALTAWVVASVGGVLWAFATASSWKNPVAWSGGWLLFIVALWWAIATLQSESDNSDSADELLGRRLARDEIDEPEYRQARAAPKD